MIVYKILTPGEWAAFDAADRFDGTPLDDGSGFVHLSSRDQVAATAGRFFPAGEPLIVVGIETDQLADVRWERVADLDQDFPHSYGPLTRSAVVTVTAVAAPDRVEEALAGR